MDPRPSSPLRRPGGLVEPIRTAPPCRLAAENDSDFTVRSFTEALRAIARLSHEDWPDDPATVVVVRRGLEDWRQRLLPACVGSRPPTAISSRQPCANGRCRAGGASKSMIVRSPRPELVLHIGPRVSSGRGEKGRRVLSCTPRTRSKLLLAALGSSGGLDGRNSKIAVRSRSAGQSRRTNGSHRLSTRKCRSAAVPIVVPR